VDCGFTYKSEYDAMALRSIQRGCFRSKIMKKSMKDENGSNFIIFAMKSLSGRASSSSSDIENGSHFWFSCM